jgi:hypothetical protein
VLDAIGFPQNRSVIKFDVTIPQRRHKELIPQLFEPFACERFRYLSLHGPGGPATFVRPLEETSALTTPSMVALVREFLIEQLDAFDAPVTLITTGPSPCPANFSASVY